MAPLAIGTQLFVTPGNFFAIFFATKERSPEILVALKCSLCDIPEGSIFSCI